MPITFVQFLKDVLGESVVNQISGLSEFQDVEPPEFSNTTKPKIHFDHLKIADFTDDSLRWFINLTDEEEVAGITEWFNAQIQKSDVLLGDKLKTSRIAKIKHHFMHCFEDDIALNASNLQLVHVMMTYYNKISPGLQGFFDKSTLLKLIAKTNRDVYKSFKETPVDSNRNILSAILLAHLLGRPVSTEKFYSKKYKQLSVSAAAGLRDPLCDDGIARIFIREIFVQKVYKLVMRDGPSVESLEEKLASLKKQDSSADVFYRRIQSAVQLEIYRRKFERLINSEGADKIKVARWAKNNSTKSVTFDLISLIMRNKGIDLFEVYTLDEIDEEYAKVAVANGYDPVLLSKHTGLEKKKPEVYALLCQLGKSMVMDCSDEDPECAHMAEGLSPDGEEDGQGPQKRRKRKNDGTLEDTTSRRQHHLFQPKYLGGIVPGAEHLGASNLAQTEYSTPNSRVKARFSNTVSFEPIEAQNKIGVSILKSLEFDGHAKFKLRHNCDLAVEKPYLFIFAGRGLGAYVPTNALHFTPVIVITKTEFEDVLGEGVPSHCKVLVLESLSHYDVSYDLSTISARRIAANMLALNLGLDSFFFTDDNIQELLLNAQPEALVCEMRSQNAITMGVSTYSAKRDFFSSGMGVIADKFLCVDMVRLRGSLPDFERMILTGYPPELQKALGVDIYFQFLCENCFKDQGYGRFSRDRAVLTRATQGQNSWLSTGNPSKTLLNVAPDFLKSHAHFPERTNAAIQQVVDELQKSIQFQQERLRKEKTKNMFEVHWEANKFLLPTGNDLSMLTNMLGDELSRDISGFRAYLKALFDTNAEAFSVFGLRAYQLAAIRAIAYNDDKAFNVILATGCGKTYLEMALAVLARCYLGPQGKSIFIVCANRQLVTQMYHDFITFSQNVHSVQFDAKCIVKVMSHEKALGAGAFILNDRVKQGGIVIFCKESYNRIIKHCEFRPAMSVYDEGHKMRLTVVERVGDLQMNLTATPGDILKGIPTAFNFSRLNAVQEGYVPPLVHLALGDDYSKEKAEEYGNNMHNILRNLYLPNGRKFVQASGIIYTTSKKEAEKITGLLNAHNIMAVCIHSGIVKRKEYLNAFKQFTHENRSIILVAVEMLQEGFSSGKVEFVINLRNSSAITQEQCAGRAARKGKHEVATMVTFQDAKLGALGLKSLKVGGRELLCDAQAVESLNDSFLFQIPGGGVLQHAALFKAPEWSARHDNLDSYKGSLPLFCSSYTIQSMVESERRITQAAWEAFYQIAADLANSSPTFPSSPTLPEEPPTITTGGEDLSVALAKARSLQDAVASDKIGPRHFPGLSVVDVSDDGNCFFYAISWLMMLYNVPFSVSHEKPWHELRKSLYTESDPLSADGAWATQDTIHRLAKQYTDYVIAIADSRHSDLGFRCYWYDSETKQIQESCEHGVVSTLGRKILPLLYTGNHYLPVYQWDKVTQGAIQGGGEIGSEEKRSRANAVIPMPKAGSPSSVTAPFADFAGGPMASAGAFAGGMDLR